jgi:hypothetical protein
MCTTIFGASRVVRADLDDPMKCLAMTVLHGLFSAGLQLAILVISTVNDNNNSYQDCT